MAFFHAEHSKVKGTNRPSPLFCRENTHNMLLLSKVSLKVATNTQILAQVKAKC